MKTLISMGLVAGLAISLPIQAGATTISESFTVSGSTDFPAGEATLPGTSFAQFNPALGTLNDIEFSLTGNANWTSPNDTTFADVLSLHLNCCGAHESVVPGLNFGTPGSLAIHFSGTDSSAGGLVFFEGAGTTNLNLQLDELLSGDAFAITTDGGLQGTVIYDYTPAATGVPEPLTLSLFGAGLIGAAAMRRRKAKTVDA